MKMAENGLIEYEMANNFSAWWFPDGLLEDNKIRYIDYNDRKRSRAVIGIKGKKVVGDVKVPKSYWHFGMTARALTGEDSYILLQPRIIISEDKKTPLENKMKLNSTRRSLTKLWFNEKWRGLVLGFSSWLANEGEVIELNVGKDSVIRISRMPMTFEVPVSILADPANSIETDEQAEEYEQKEALMRQVDPAFYVVDEDREGERE